MQMFPSTIFIMHLVVLTLCWSIVLAAPPYDGTIPMDPVLCGTNIGQYTSCGFGLGFNITSPASMMGRIRYLPWISSPHLKFDGILERRVLIPNSRERNPNSGDGNPNGCSLGTSSNPIYPGFLNLTADDGTPFRDNILIILSGKCIGTDQQLSIEALKPALVLTVDSAPNLNYGTENMPPVNVGTFGTVTTNMTVPFLTIPHADGLKLVNALRAGQTITAAFHGSGRTSTKARAALTTIANSLSFPQDLFYMGPTFVPLSRISSSSQNADQVAGRPPYDPCYDGIKGIWCERGEPVGFLWGFPGPYGTLPAAIGDLDELVYMMMVNIPAFTAGLTGALPSTICGLKKLRWIDLTGNSLTSLPDCFDNTNIQFLIVPGNKLAAFPHSIAQSRSILNVQLNSNPIQGPIPLSFKNCTALQVFQLSSITNQFVNQIPDFSGLQNLTVIWLHSSNFKGIMSPNNFDNIPWLKDLRLQLNGARGVLPTLIGSTKYLIDADFSSNQFSGAIPGNWDNAFPVISTMKLRDNLLSGMLSEFRPLASLALKIVDLSRNQISNGVGTNGAAYMISACVTRAVVVEIDFSYNNLTGPFDNNIFTTTTLNLKRLVVSHNKLTTLSADLWKVPNLQHVDFSHNQLTSTSLPTGAPPAGLVFADFSSNPNFVSAVNPAARLLPSFVKFDQTALIKAVGIPQSCFQIVGTLNPAMVVKFDPIYYGYSGCSCDDGFYGGVPNCIPIPRNQSLSLTSSPPPLLTGSVNTGPVPIRTFTDDWYGTGRVLKGLDTVWEIDTRNHRTVKIAGTNNITFQLHSDPIPSGSTIDIIRVIYLNFFIDLSQFSRATDIINIYEGDNRLTDKLVQSIRPSQLQPIDRSKLPEEVRTAQFESQYAKYYNWTQLSFTQVQVVAQICSINYQSRDQSGKHFFVTFTGSSDPPAGYRIDPITNLAVRIEPDLPEYQIGYGVRIAVYAASGVVSSAVLITAAIIIYYKDTSLVRAASRPFTGLILLMLLTMSGAAVLYGIIPYDFNTRICNARVWLSSLSLMGLLGVLTAKSFRVQKIFTSKLLTQVKQVSDSDVATISGVLLLIEFIMMIIFNTRDMSVATFSPGSGTTNGYRVWSCNRQNGFDAWIGAQIAIFALLMLGSAAIAFRTREVPSAFNESTHIMASLFLMIFFMIILVPLDYLISDNPEGAIIVQGCGQCLLSLFLLTFNFAPKLYYLLTKRGNDKSLIFTQTSVGAAISAKKSSKGGSTSSHNATSAGESNSGINSNSGTQMSRI